jgi:hypothetical protein
MRERHVVVVRKRCRFCHAILEAGLMDLFPKLAGPPRVCCKRCGRATHLSLLVAVASSAAGLLGGAVVVMCCRALAESMFGKPLGIVHVLLMLPIGLSAWMLGYIAFAASCYGLQGIWHRFNGTH